MEDRQSSRQDGADASLLQRVNETTRELGEKMKKIDMKPPSTPTVGLLAKNAVLLPSGIIRVEQLRDSALNQASAPKSSGSATGNPRNKTALAPGHSLMDWIRLGTSGVDLTGVGGRLLTVTPAELARHNKENDAWIAIRGVVFNVSRYMSFHPGGIPELMKGVGKDATKLFDDVHAWVNYQSILQHCVVGRLQRTASAELYFESEKNKSKKSTRSENATDPVPNPPDVKMDWRQTTNTVSLFYSVPADELLGECRLKKLGNSEFGLQMCLEKTGDSVVYEVLLDEDVEWPPNCQRSIESREIEITFKKKDRGIWKRYGLSSTPSREKTNLKKRTYNTYEVLENTPLCKVVHLLVLRAQNYIQLVPPGRHIAIKMDIMGTEVSRLYTPVPCCLHPEDRPSSYTGDDCLCLMVKRYEDGAMSPRLTELQPTDEIDLSSSLGDFRLEEYDGYETMHLLVAGTGLTAVLSIVKRTLSRRNAPTINLINFNKNEDNVFYARQLDRVAAERSLTVTHKLTDGVIISNEQAGSFLKDFLKDCIGEHSPKSCIFTCGPPGFMTAAREALQNLGWKSSQIYEFDG